MAEFDHNFGADTFPAHIELCGICGRRVHRLPIGGCLSIR
jgi:hypothetical protein